MRIRDLRRLSDTNLRLPQQVGSLLTSVPCNSALASPPRVTMNHLIKYPYSFFAPGKELKDDSLKQRVFEKLYHLSAVS